MRRVFINNMEREFNIDVCKVSREIIGTVPCETINSINRSINDIDTIELSIQRTIKDGNNRDVLNPLWDLLKEERLLFLNNKEYFVIKNNGYTSEKIKNITAYSLEYKLGKIDINIEDIAIQLMESDVENGIYSLNDYLKEETGWSIGYIDDTVRYDIDDEGNKTEKLRVQDSVNMRWYDFLMDNIAESFNALITFDTLNRTVNLYDVETVGENIQLYLSNDNYVKSLERDVSSEDIVTRMFVVGNEEMDIIDATATGYPYLEDYSYFIDNKEMSNELIEDLKLYKEMVAIRNETWKTLVNLKEERNKVLTTKKTELYIIYEEIRAKKSIKEVYSAKGDVENEVIIAQQITELIDKQVVLEIEIKDLETEIQNLNSSIVEIIILCKRETATDLNGELIFNERTLEELKEFVYHETYENSSFLNVEDLIKAGERELSLKSYPTVEYTIDVANFMDRIIDNNFRQHWNGELGLGDVIILYDEDLEEEVFLFLTKYTQMPNEGEEGLDLTLSNKKFKDSNIRTIADKLKEGSLAMGMVNRKSYLFNKQKYNRINLTKEQIGGNI